MQCLINRDYGLELSNRLIELQESVSVNVQATTIRVLHNRFRRLRKIVDVDLRHSAIDNLTKVNKRDVTRAGAIKVALGCLKNLLDRVDDLDLIDVIIL